MSFSLRIQPLTLGLVLACSPLTAALADPLGSAASSASSAGSASLGSLSESVQGSSRSSSGKTQTAEGMYRVKEVASAPGRPDHRVLRLQAVNPAPDASDELLVQVPVKSLGAQGMSAGEQVQVRHRVYGLEFARAPQDGPMEPFFLALEEAWQRQLASRPVTL
jgi:hypothetical protein